jgi:hypothetical protein
VARYRHAICDGQAPARQMAQRRSATAVVQQKRHRAALRRVREQLESFEVVSRGHSHRRNHPGRNAGTGEQSERKGSGADDKSRLHAGPVDAHKSPKYGELETSVFCLFRGRAQGRWDLGRRRQRAGSCVPLRPRQRRPPGDALIFLGKGMKSLERMRSSSHSRQGDPVTVAR